jgi:hypothetical protein
MIELVWNQEPSEEYRQANRLYLQMGELLARSNVNDRLIYWVSLQVFAYAVLANKQGIGRATKDLTTMVNDLAAKLEAAQPTSLKVVDPNDTA